MLMSMPSAKHCLFPSSSHAKYFLNSASIFLMQYWFDGMANMSFALVLCAIVSSAAPSASLSHATMNRNSFVYSDSDSSSSNTAAQFLKRLLSLSLAFNLISCTIGSAMVSHLCSSGFRACSTEFSFVKLERYSFMS